MTPKGVVRGYRALQNARVPTNRSVGGVEPSPGVASPGCRTYGAAAYGLYHQAMCGRFTHKFTWKELHDLLARGRWPERLSLAELPEPNFNVAPTQSAPIIRAVAGAGGKVTGIEVVALRWGLAPHWAESPDRGPINARAETAATNAMFRAAFNARRCLVPTSGFYEWQRPPGGAKAPKRPFYITRADGRPLLMAGLWERWGPKDSCTETFAILTTAANEFMSGVHDRMPVVIEPEDAPTWLDPSLPGKDDPDAGRTALTALLRPAAAGVLQMHEVSTSVNNPRSTGEKLLNPL